MNSDLNAYEKNDIEFSDGSERPDEELIESSEDVENAPKPNSQKGGNGKTEIVGIRFRKNGKTYYFAPAGFKLSRGDRVIVDTARGQEYGYTAVPNRMINDSEIVAPLRSVVRMASADDTRTHEENLKKEVDAFNSCIMLIDENKLEMKLIDVEMSFDRSKLIFYFSAEGRVDFRELVKELAGKFRTRIEMRQIGIRDEAKILGGLGICGRPFCCSSFLTDFVQVSVKMAKEQNLSLNSAKISGSCGRLMCCLRYEYDTYLDEKARTPKVDTRVMTPDGAGVVTAANPLAGIVKVKLDKRGDDSEHVVFIREDVVRENEYKGEKLVKSAVPDRKHKEDENDIFAFAGALGGLSENKTATQKPAFEPPKPVSPAPEKRPEQRNSKAVENVPEKREEVARPQSNNQSENKQGGKKKHHHNRFNNQKRDGNGERNENKHQKPQEQQKPVASQNNAQRNEGNQGGKNVEKKKHFKPYYRNRKKNRNKGGGDAQNK